MDSECTNPDHADPQHWLRNSRWCYGWNNGAPHPAHDLVDEHGDSVEHCEGHAEPAPPQTVAEQVRDLERIIERVREAVGTDQPDPPAAPPDANLAQLILKATGIDVAHSAAPDYASWLATACRLVIQSENARDQLRKDHNEARQWARHGYEIGQRHCGWSDHGVAPAWLTEGWPPHIGPCEHAARAAEYDTTLSQVRTLASKRLDEDECSPQERDGYHDAMRMVLALLNDSYEGRPVEPDGEDE